MISTLLFDGVDLSTMTGVIASDLSGMWAPMTRRGDHDTIPGRDGQLGAQLPFDAYQFTVPIVVGGTGYTDAGLNALMLSLGTSLAGAGGLGTLTRRLASDDEGGYTEYTAAGAFGGISGVQFTGQADAGDFEISCDLLFTNLDGGWKRTSDDVWVRP